MDKEYAKNFLKVILVAVAVNFLTVILPKIISYWPITFASIFEKLKENIFSSKWWIAVCVLYIFLGIWYANKKKRESGAQRSKVMSENKTLQKLVKECKLKENLRSI